MFSTNPSHHTSLLRWQSKTSTQPRTSFCIVRWMNTTSLNSKINKHSTVSMFFTFFGSDVESSGMCLTIGSTAGTPARVRRSASIADFIRMSKGVSTPKDGDRFTSRSQGFRDESIKISNPYNSEIHRLIKSNQNFISLFTKTIIWVGNETSCCDDRRCCCQNRLNNHIFHPTHQQRCVFAFSTEVPQQRA